MKIKELLWENGNENNIKTFLSKYGQVKVTTINNLYKEYVVYLKDIPKNTENMNDRQLTSLPEIRKIRSNIKSNIGESNIKNKTVLAIFQSTGNKKRPIIVLQAKS